MSSKKKSKLRYKKGDVDGHRLSKTASEILGLRKGSSITKFLEEAVEEAEEVEEQPPPEVPLEGFEAPLVYLRQHGQRNKEIHRFDWKRVGNIVRTVVELQLHRQETSEQRLDGLEKTWSLVRLEQLSLVHLELRKIDPRIGKMLLLTTCDFSYNLLTDESFPSEIGNCLNLRSVKITDNKLTRIPKAFASLGNLQRLDLQNNRISSLKGLNMFGRLESLNVAYNRLLLFDVGPLHKNPMKNLQIIDCSFNHITAIITDFAEFPKLVDIDFSCNGLRYLNPGILKNTNLYKVNLSSNYIFKMKIPEGGRWARTKNTMTQSMSPNPPTLPHGSTRFLDLSDNRLTRLPHGIVGYFDDVDLTENRIRYIRSPIIKDLSTVRAHKEVDLTSNPLTCFQGHQKYRKSPQNLFNYLLDYKDRLENHLYRGMKIIVLGAAGSGKTEFIDVLFTDNGLDFRQKIVEHSLRMRRWLFVYDYYLDAYFPAATLSPKALLTPKKQPMDHRIVHSSLWQFSGTIRNATLDYVFIKNEQMLMKLVINIAEFQVDFEYEIIGLWLDMVMTYSMSPCIIIPIGMFGEEIPIAKCETLIRRIEKWLSSFLTVREQEYMQLLEELETVGQSKLSMVGNLKLAALRDYKSRIPLVHEKVMKIGPGITGISEVLNLVKAAAFHKSFFGKYVTIVPSNTLEVENLIDQMISTMDVPMMMYSEFSSKFQQHAGGNIEGIEELLRHLHSTGRIFWFGKDKHSEHHNDIIFLDSQWLIDTLYSILDRESVMQMAAQSKNEDLEEFGYDQCIAFTDKGIMSVDILKHLWKSVMPDYVLKHETFIQLMCIFMTEFKIGFPIDSFQEYHPSEIPKGRFFINPNDHTIEWLEVGGKGDPKIEPNFYQIPYLMYLPVQIEVEDYLKDLGLVESADAKKQQHPILEAEFFFPIFSPRGLFARSITHIHQVLKNLIYVNIWKDGVWARSTCGQYGLLIREIVKETYKEGPATNTRACFRFQFINLKTKQTDQNNFNNMWTLFTTILKETESIFLWFPGLFYNAYSLCPTCHNAACPSEWHDGREIAKTKSLKCKSCGKEVLTYYVVKTVH